MEGAGGQAGSGSHYPPCQLWMEPTGLWHILQSNNGSDAHSYTFPSALLPPPPSNKCSFFHAASLAIYQADTWSLSPKEPPPTASQEVGAPLSIGIIKELFTPAGNKPYL